MKRHTMMIHIYIMPNFPPYFVRSLDELEFGIENSYAFLFCCHIICTTNTSTYVKEIVTKRVKTYSIKEIYLLKRISFPKVQGLVRLTEEGHTARGHIKQTQEHGMTWPSNEGRPQLRTHNKLFLFI